MYFRRSRCYDRKLLRGLQFLVLLPFVVSLGCDIPNNSDSLAKNPAAAITVNAFEIQQVNQTTTSVTYFGKLEPNQQRTLRFATAGELKSVAKRGSTFADGELLAEITDPTFDQQKASIESNLKLARDSGQITQAQQLEQQLADLQNKQSKNSLTAPFAGIVLNAFANVGSSITPRSSVLEIADLSEPLVRINLPGRIAKWLTPEMNINLVIDGEPFQGNLESKSATQNAAGNSQVWFALAQNAVEQGWTFGQSVEVRFDFDEPDTGFWLPLEAVQRAGPGLWSVLTIGDAAGEQNPDSANENDLRPLQKRIVTVKKFAGDRVFVEGELTDGELVVANGRHRVVANQRVNVRPWRFVVADQSGESP